jgi:hypothetical protein
VLGRAGGWPVVFLVSRGARLQAGIDTDCGALKRRGAYMMRQILRWNAAIVLLTLAGVGSMSQLLNARTQAQQATPAQAKPFVGQWSLALQGPNGPAAFDLTVKVENEKVAAEIASEQMPKQAISDVTLDKESLVLSYSFDYQGNAVDAVVSLVPAQDSKVAAQISFAGGAYVMSGSATKKESAK